MDLHQTSHNSYKRRIYWYQDSAVSPIKWRCFHLESLALSCARNWSYTLKKNRFDRKIIPEVYHKNTSLVCAQLKRKDQRKDSCESGSAWKKDTAAQKCLIVHIKLNFHPSWSYQIKTGKTARSGWYSCGDWILEWTHIFLFWYIYWNRSHSLQIAIHVTREMDKYDSTIQQKAPHFTSAIRYILRFCTRTKQNTQ